MPFPRFYPNLPPTLQATGLWRLSLWESSHRGLKKPHWAAPRTVTVHMIGLQGKHCRATPPLGHCGPLDSHTQ